MSAETIEFKTELKQLLDIIVHSLYSNREIFLRELLSNACDAIDKARFEALTDTELLGDDSEFEIELIADAEGGTLFVVDNGIGMTREGIADQLGTIAKSGTKQFLEALKEQEGASQPELIGQFGVGFYSAFMVADRIDVLSRAAGSEEAVRWSSTGEGTFTIEDATRERRGTSIIMHLKEDAKEFLEPYRLRSLVKKYSDFVEHPIVMQVTKEVEGEETTEREVLNSRQAIWRRPKSEVSDEEYAQFYKQVSRDFADPSKVIHYRAEGTLEFRALLFVPSQRPFDMFMGDQQSGLQLYVQRVMITDDCEKLLPGWMRFVRGVVESSDLPLNVSRELIQEDRILTKIRSNLTKKVLDTLEEWKDEAYNDFVDFHEHFGPLLKEGLASDFEQRERISELLLFESIRTPAGGYVGLGQYVENMPEDQPAIYYLTGEEREVLESSPYLEAIRERGWDVLLLTDPIDEWVVDALPQYKEKPLQALDRGEIEDLDEADEQQVEAYASLCEALGDKIDDVSEVRLSRRLTDSAACLVAGEGAMSAHMERLMARMGRDGEMPKQARVLELNAQHPAVVALHGLYESDRADPRVESVGRLLYDQAVVAEGNKIADPAGFARRLNDLIASTLGGSSGSAE